jgi:hypothetical protein
MVRFLGESVGGAGLRRGVAEDPSTYKARTGRVEFEPNNFAGVNVGTVFYARPVCSPDLPRHSLEAMVMIVGRTESAVANQSNWRRAYRNSRLLEGEEARHG